MNTPIVVPPYHCVCGEMHTDAYQFYDCVRARCRHPPECLFPFDDDEPDERVICMNCGQVWGTMAEAMAEAMDQL